jgi:hypothetical protein
MVGPREKGPLMMTITANRLSAIQRASRGLRGLLIFLFVILVLGVLSNLTHPQPQDAKTLAGVEFLGAAITAKIQLLWLLQIVLRAAIYLKLFYHLIRLLSLYSEGKLFTAQNVAQIRQLGLTFMFAPAVWLIVLIGAAPEIMAAQDQWLKIMSSFPGGALMNGGILLLVSWIMNEGRELRDEQDLVV